MYVCICNALTDSDVTDIITTNNVVCMTELKQHNICDNCTKCFDSVRDILVNCVDERFKDQDWYISPKEDRHWFLYEET